MLTNSEQAWLLIAQLRAQGMQACNGSTDLDASNGSCIANQGLIHESALMSPSILDWRRNHVSTSAKDWCIANSKELPCQKIAIQTPCVLLDSLFSAQLFGLSSNRQTGELVAVVESLTCLTWDVMSAAAVEPCLLSAASQAAQENRLPTSTALHQAL